MRIREIDVVKVNEIVRLLDDAYDHYFDRGGDGAKSSEGYVELAVPNYFDRRADKLTPGMAQLRCNVYSYLFGPSRMHSFDSIDEALDTVRKWYNDEIADDSDLSEGWG